MYSILRTFLTCLALAFAASASGMRAPAVERVEAAEAAAISINQLSPQNTALSRRGYSIVRYQNISELEVNGDWVRSKLGIGSVDSCSTAYKVGEIAGEVTAALILMQARSPCNSFTGDTLVHVRPPNAAAQDALKGTAVLKPISQLQLGDEVLAFNEWKPKATAATSIADTATASNHSTSTTDPRLSYEKVVDIYTSYKPQTLIHITLDNGQQISTTEGHPFKTTDGWRDAILLKKGGQLLLKGGGGDAADGADAADATITIADVRQEVKTVAVYNLEVANAHTFFVGVDGVLVHNANANRGKAKPHGGAAHDARIETYIRRLEKWTSVDTSTIRKNQWQVPFGCNKAVGRNRPDVQFDYKGKHYNREFDTIPANSTAHGTTILGNDPLSAFTGTLVK
jgi:Pretoxin HINT domain